MRILLTGAAGFLGKATVEVLKREHDVVTTDRVGVVDMLGDLTDPAFVKTLPSVQIVVHAAAVQYASGRLPILGYRTYFNRNNVAATRLLCNRYERESVHFVFVGSSMMYLQRGSDAYSPKSEMGGQGIYSSTKLAAHNLIKATFPRWATVIPCIIGGSGREGLFRRLVESLRRHRRVTIPGSGSHLTQMVHVDDVASLIGLVVRRSATGLYNAAGPEPLSVDQWITEISDHLGLSSVKIQRLPLEPVRAMSMLTGYRLLAREQLLMLEYPHVLDTCGSIELGWEPQRTNAQIVREVADYITNSE